MPSEGDWEESIRGPIINIFQFLTGRWGYQYMSLFKPDISPDNPNRKRGREHIFSHYPKFVEEKRNLEETLGEALVPENLTQRMLA